MKADRVSQFKGFFLQKLSTHWRFDSRYSSNHGVGLAPLPRSGFTLIELLVVIAIIGILASVVMASLNSAREKSRDATRMSQLKEMQKALEMYYADHGSYPVSPGSTWRGTTSGCYGAASVTGQNAIPGLVSGGYISVLPEDPTATGSSACYLYISNGTDYMFLAHGTVESFDPDGPPAHPMDRARYNQQSIAVYSPGARMW